MTKNRKWLVLPPAVALLLVLGPLSMKPSAAAERSAETPAAAPVVRPTAGPQQPAADRGVPALPRTPDLWQIGSTLLGVLLLGGVAVAVLRRLRQGPAATGSGAVSLRQTLRLSNKQAVHALEFEGKLLLVGETERGLQLLIAHTPPTAADDEAAVAAVAARLRDELDDDGAVPKNLVLPRPQRTAAPARPTPTPTKARASTDAAAKNPFSDFRALLAKVGR